jgi:hypothetical protein
MVKALVFNFWQHCVEGCKCDVAAPRGSRGERSGRRRVGGTVLLWCRRKRGRGEVRGRPHYRGGRVCGKCERNSPPRFFRPITVHPLFHHNASLSADFPKTAKPSL